MSSMINTNLISLNAQQNLNTNQASLATSIQRLSSGLRINSAKDDAAGLAISARMTSQVNGLTQASRNANDGISMAQTAEGGLGTITDLLQRMRTLAVQSANGTNSASDRASLQAEVSQDQQEINRVAQTTQFNGLNVLDGTMNNAQFQVGANANQTISFSISNAQANALGNNKVGSTAVAAPATTLTEAKASATALIAANVFKAQTLTISGNGTTVSTPVLAAGSSGFAIAAAVNAASGTTGVTASAVTTATLGAFAVAGGNVSLTLQGAPTGTPAVANPVTVSATMANGNDVGGLAAAINAQSGSTGITATANLNNGTIALSQSQGYDIGVLNNTAGATITLTGTTTAGGGPTAVALAASGSNGDAATVGANVTFNSATAFTVTSNVATGGIFDATTSNGSTLSSVASIDVTALTNGVPTGANNAIAIIDAALTNVNASRGSLGALQNRFTSTISNLQTTSENVTAARSRVQDADFATETANLSRGQILSQAGTAMLAQANQLPNQVLTLLR